LTEIEKKNLTTERQKLPQKKKTKMSILTRSAAFPRFQIGNILAAPWPTTALENSALAISGRPFDVIEPFSRETQSLAPVAPTLLYDLAVEPLLMSRPFPAIANATLQAARGPLRFRSFANFA
jgi:hypothetical protein